jgi:hypothetical protein
VIGDEEDMSGMFASLERLDLLGTFMEYHGYATDEK